MGNAKRYKVINEEAENEIVKAVVNHGLSQKEISHALGRSKSYFNLFIHSKGVSLTKAQLEKASAEICGDKQEIFKYVVPCDKAAEDSAPHKDSVFGIFKAGNGFRYTFDLNGKARTVYGMTKSELFKKAKELSEKENEPPKETVQAEDSEKPITIQLSDADAIILSERLFKLLREKKKEMAKDEYESIRSVYC